MIGMLLWVGGILLSSLLIAPILTFLMVSWEHRRREILCGVSSKDDAALRQYFAEFQPDFAADEPNLKRRFNSYYNALFGRKHFIVPLVLLFAVVSGLFYLCKLILESPIPKEQNFLETKGAIAVFAIMGAYLWVVYDHIKKWWHSSLSPKDIYEASFRFALSIPFGYSVSMLAAAAAGPVIAFFMGAFPMQTLLSTFRNIWGQKLGILESRGSEKSELLNLQGIDIAKAERLGAEGITTILQLAYADPIRLTIRTNLGYSFLVDCISQALLRIYTGDNQPAWQKHGLRGGFEAINLNSGLEEGDPGEKADAEMIISVLSKDLGVPAASVNNILWEVCHDPYMQFIYLSWTSGE